MNLKPEEEQQLLRDLAAILGHFEELKTVDTGNVLPMSGGATNVDVFREDGSAETKLSGDRAVESFPEYHGRFLKVPSVFEP